MSNLWDSAVFDVPADLRTPGSILGEQAAALRYRSGRVLDARVEFRTLPGDARCVPPGGGDPDPLLARTLVVVAPALDDYALPLITVDHPLSDMFRCRVTSKYADAASSEDEPGYVAALRAVMRSPGVTQAVRTLYIMARSSSDR